MRSLPLIAVLGLVLLGAIGKSAGSAVAAHPSPARDRAGDRRARIAVAVERSVAALGRAHPELHLEPRLERAFRAAWIDGLERRRSPCPGPGGPPPEESIAGRSRLAGPASAFDDSTVPPRDTLTTWVKVYEDLDEDGAWEVGEPPLAGIQVSDGTGANLGIGVALTAADGTHTFTTDSWDSRFVLVTVPSGWRATGPLWSRIRGAVDPDSVYFGLAAAPATADPVFRAVQITDPQVAFAADGGEHGDDLSAIESLAEPPRFVVVTGDLVQTGDDAQQFAHYWAGVAGHTLTIHHGYGDHDRIASGQLRVHNFESAVGPTCYSFDYGGVHWVMFNDFDAVDVEGMFRQLDWLFFDLLVARQRNGGVAPPTVICKHQLPDQAELELYNGFGAVVAVLSGHWHGSRIRSVQGILDINTPPSRFAGIDKSSRGFRILELADGGLATQLRELGIAGHARIVTPADGDTVRAGPLALRVNVYASAAVELAVTATISGPGVGLSDQPLSREPGSWLWVAGWDASGEPPGSYELTVQVTPDNGPPYVASARFELAGDVLEPRPDVYSSWPSYKYDAAGGGRSSEDLQPPLRLAWARHLGGPVNVPSPAVAGGRVYAGTGNASTAGDAGIVCLDAASGDPLWSFATGADVKSTPAIDGGGLYCTSAGGALTKLDAASGAVLWQRQLGDPVERWEMSSPTVAGGRVYAGGVGVMSALDVDSGALLWQVSGSSSTPPDFVPATYSAPAVSDAAVVFTSSRGIFAFDLAGNPLWSVAGGSQAHRSAALFGGVVYTAGPTFNAQLLQGFDAATGALVFEAATPLRESTSAPVIGPDDNSVDLRIVAAAGGNQGAQENGRLLAFRSSQPSTPVWSFAAGAPLATSLPYARSVGSINSTPAWAGRTLYFGADDGRLYGLDADTGAERWRYELGVPIRSSPAIAGNLLLVTGADGTLYAFVSTFVSSAAAGRRRAAPSGATRLLGSWPNPCNPAATIGFDLGRSDAARALALKIYDPAGRLVRTLFEGRRQAGRHLLRWDGRDGRGRRLPSATYFFELRTAANRLTGKLVLAR